jgi:primary-amine oxidase
MPRALPPLEGASKARPQTIPSPLVESIAGFSAGVVSCLTVHPLDLLKNRLQLNTKTKSRAGDSFRILRHVIRDEGGAKALYRGLWPNMLGNSLGWGLYFLFYGRAKEVLQKRKGHGEHLGSAEFFGASVFAGTQFEF